MIETDISFALIEVPMMESPFDMIGIFWNTSEPTPQQSYRDKPNKFRSSGVILDIDGLK